MDEDPEMMRKPSKLWYLLPIFLGIIGGVIGYFLLKDRNRKFAERLLIIGLVMIAVWYVLSFVLAGLAYILWATPLTEKREAQASLETVYNTMRTLEEKIKSVASVGGEDSINTDFVATWSINSLEDSVSVVFNSKISNIATGVGWISLISGATCPPSAGKLGIDSPSVICAKSDVKDDRYEISYKVWFRELDGYKINLENIGKTESSNVKSISVERTTSGKITTVSISLIE